MPEVLQKQAQRTFMPEILNPGSGLSPTTTKSIIPTNNVFTIQDVLNGKTYRLPGAGGSWGNGEDSFSSYKDQGDDYKREERDMSILKRMFEPNQEKHEQWAVALPGGVRFFISLQLAQEFKRKMTEKGKQVQWIRKLCSAQGDEQSRQAVIAASMVKTFKVVVNDTQRNLINNGAAFCVAPGKFITCAHVIRKYNKMSNETLNLSQIGRSCTIELQGNGKRYPATLRAVHEPWDIALLESNVDAMPFEFDMKPLLGDEILVVGSPHGFENNVTFGNISSFNRTIYTHQGAPKYLFIDANVFSGNSGGPIIEMRDGKVVGMVTAIAAATGEYGLNAGLPAKYLEKFLQHGKLTANENETK